MSEIGERNMLEEIFPEGSSASDGLQATLARLESASRLIALPVGLGHDLGWICRRLASRRGWEVRMWPHEPVPHDMPAAVVHLDFTDSDAYVDELITPAVSAKGLARRQIVYPASRRLALRNESLRWSLETWRLEVPNWRAIYPDIRTAVRVQLREMDAEDAVLTPEVWAAIDAHPWEGGQNELGGRLLRAITIGKDHALTPAGLESIS